jgi:hypothetical protein
LEKFCDGTAFLQEEAVAKGLPNFGDFLTSGAIVMLILDFLAVD